MIIKVELENYQPHLFSVTPYYTLSSASQSKLHAGLVGTSNFYAENGKEVVVMNLPLNFIGMIDDYSVNYLVEKIEPHRKDLESVRINIHSSGGSVAGAIAIYNYLKSLPFEVKTHNLAEVSSAAVPIYLAGKVRTSEPISKFVIHPIKSSKTEGLSYYQVEEILQMLDSDIKSYAEIVNCETNSLNGLHNVTDCLKGYSITLNRQEALECGIVTL